jgi:Cu(I)/Ag(I) efflux system membrane fusion protein
MSRVVSRAENSSGIGFHLRLVALLAAIALVAGCGPGGSGGDDEDSAAPPPSAIVMAVSGAKVQAAAMRQEIRLLGTTIAERHLMLRAPAAGRIIGFDLLSGAVLRRGQVVARVVNREIEAAESGLAIARTLDPPEAPALAAAVRRNAAPAAIAVIVPQDAIVAQRLVSTGQLVAELDPLADLIDPRSIAVEAQVPVDALADLRVGMPAVVTSPLRPDAHWPARIAAIAPSFAAGGATAPVRIEFSGPDRIALAGAPTEVRIVTSELPDALAMPAAALFEDAPTRRHYVFVAGDDGRAHRRDVTVGINDAAHVQIVSGLSAGETVITSGGYALADGLRVKVAVGQW